MRPLAIASLTLSLLTLLGCLTVVCPVQAYTTVNGTITQDTTWTKNGSPYNIASNLFIAEGATLTIEPGVTVNLGSYYLYVNGTLNARGSVNDKIVFQKNTNSTSWYLTSQITFSPTSQGWNEQTGKGCIIENADLVSVSLSIAGSPKISGIETNSSMRISSGSPIITDSRFNIQDGINILYSSPSFIGNFIVGSGPEVSGLGVYGSGNVTFTGNNVSGFHTAIKVNSGNWQISGNTISNSGNGIELNPQAQVAIYGNLINNNTLYGIDGGNASSIHSNTITNNKIGIHNPLAAASIHYNNILGNLVNSITATTSDIFANDNWWGTTDIDVINQTIYDHIDDDKWGTVFYTPILIVPSQTAPAIPEGTLVWEAIQPSTEPTTPPQTVDPPPSYTPMPLVDQNIIKNRDNQDRSLLNLNLLVVALAIPLVVVWVVVLLGYRVIGKIREIREG